MKKILIRLAAFCLLLTSFSMTPVHAADGVDMYRMYNPNSGEHFYTGKAKERDALVKSGWLYEGIGWTAPKTSKTPVYRLYNKNAGDHHYTVKTKERDALVKAGWKDEGIGWYSDDAKTVPVYREYNEKMQSHNHNYTANEKEHNALVKMGWKDEGIGWYALKGKQDGVKVSMDLSVIDEELKDMIDYFQFGYQDKSGKKNFDSANPSSCNLIRYLGTHPAIVNYRFYGQKAQTDHWDSRKDPLGKINSEYTEFPVSSVKWAAKNLFHLTDPVINKMVKECKDQGIFYEYKGSFISLLGGVGGPGMVAKFSSVRSDGSRYYIEYKYYIDPDYYLGTYTLVAAKEKIGNKYFWTMYKHSEK